MHDQVIIQQLLKALGNNKPLKVTIEVGEIAPLDEHHLVESWEQMTDIGIETLSRKAKVACSCGYTGKPKIVERLHDFVLIECPKCHKMPKVIDGDKITLKSLELDD